MFSRRVATGAAAVATAVTLVATAAPASASDQQDEGQGVTTVVLNQGLVPALVFFLWYDAVRFGSPFESGYGLATLNAELQAKRAIGLFSLAHVPMKMLSPMLT